MHFHPIGASRLQNLWPDCKQKSSQWVIRSWHHPLIERHHYSSEGSACYFLCSPVRYWWLPWGCQVNECHDNDDLINVFQFSSVIFYHVLCSLLMIMVKMIWLSHFFYKSWSSPNLCSSSASQYITFLGKKNRTTDTEIRFGVCESF